MRPRIDSANPFCSRAPQGVRVDSHCYMLHVTLRPPHFPRLFTPQRTQCKGYSKYAHKVHIALLCAISIRDKKSWKIFVILFGGIKKSMYLCRRFSGARQSENKLSFALACKIFCTQLQDLRNDSTEGLRRAYLRQGRGISK